MHSPDYLIVRLKTKEYFVMVLLLS